MKTIIETAPKFKVTVKDIEDLPTELEKYAAIYQELFGRREQKEHYQTYLEGLMLDVPNKSVETMMLNLKGDDPNSIRNMQHFLSEGSWQDKTILQRHGQEVSHDLGDENGVLIGDGSGFPKQGEESVAVKRQWCGQLGKIANCQVGVFLGYASQHGRTLLDRRLYLPQEWVEDDDYAERRRKCGVPTEITFKTKPALLLEMVKEVHAEGSLPFRWLTCDEAFGRDTAFLDQVGNYLWYFAEVELTPVSGWSDHKRSCLIGLAGVASQAASGLALVKRRHRRSVSLLLPYQLRPGHNTESKKGVKGQ